MAGPRQRGRAAAAVRPGDVVIGRLTAAGSVLAVFALLAPATASAVTDGEARFLDDMASINVEAHHDHVGDNERESRSVLNLGYNFCANVRKYGLDDAKRVILGNSQTRTAMGEGGQLSGSDVDLLASSAQHNLCSDTL